MAPVQSSLMEVEQDDLIRLYQPLLLEKALTMVHQPYPHRAEDDPALPDDSLLSSEQAFQSFVNKLAQACDSRPGGDTVTAVTVLRTDDGPLYVVASNFRTSKELQSTKSFLTSLLELIPNQQEMGRKALLKQIMCQILAFNFCRVKTYLNRLVTCLDDCLEDCENKRSLADGKAKTSPELEGELMLLRTRANFPRDMHSNPNAKNKFLSDCDTLIKAIHGARGKYIDEAIKSQSKNGEMTISQMWHELRHYLGRLLSYRQAAGILIGAFERWPLLFDDFQVITVPSSLKKSRPLPKENLTAADIIRNMTEDKDEAEIYLNHAQNLQSMGLDERIQQEVDKKTFRPVVHAEVGLHTYLLHFDLNHPRKYWNGYKYIGSSKPTCRLCSYYFFGHRDKVIVRAAHMNLYTNWQFPAALRTEGKVGQRANTKLLELLIELVRNDAKRTMDERRPRGKKHDSNTESAIPGYFNIGSRASLSETSSLDRLDLQDDAMLRVGPSQVTMEDQLDQLEIADTESDDKGGDAAGFVLEEE